MNLRYKLFRYATPTHRCAYLLFARMVIYGHLSKNGGLKDLQFLSDISDFTHASKDINLPLFQDLDECQFTDVGGQRFHNMVEEVLKIVSLHSDEKSLTEFLGHAFDIMTTKKQRFASGQYHTPGPLRDLCVKYAIREGSERVFEPGTGTGLFLFTAIDRMAGLTNESPQEIVKRVRGLEYDLLLHRVANSLLRLRYGINEDIVDYGDYFALKGSGEYDVIIGNPPYTRFSVLPESVRARFMEALKGTGVESLRYEKTLEKLWVLHSASHLRDGGRLSFVLSYNILQTLDSPLWQSVNRWYHTDALLVFRNVRFHQDPTTPLIMFSVRRDVPSGDENTMIAFIQRSIDADELLSTINFMRSSNVVVYKEDTMTIKKVPTSFFVMFKDRRDLLLFDYDKIKEQLDLIQKHFVHMDAVFIITNSNFANLYRLIADNKVRMIPFLSAGVFYIDSDKGLEYGLRDLILTARHPSLMFKITGDKIKGMRRELKFMFNFEDEAQMNSTALAHKEKVLRDDFVPSPSLGQIKRPFIRTQVYRFLTHHLGKWYNLGKVIYAPIVFSRFNIIPTFMFNEVKILSFSTSYWMLMPRRDVSLDYLKAYVPLLMSSPVMLQISMFSARPRRPGIVKTEIQTLDRIRIPYLEPESEYIGELSNILDDMDEYANRLLLEKNKSLIARVATLLKYQPRIDKIIADMYEKRGEKLPIDFSAVRYHLYDIWIKQGIIPARLAHLRP